MQGIEGKKIKELEDKKIEINQTEQERIETRKIKNKASDICGSIAKDLTSIRLEFQKKRKKGGAHTVF